VRRAKEDYALGAVGDIGEPRFVARCSKGLWDRQIRVLMGVG
jgi:hypothetical protein